MSTTPENFNLSPPLPSPPRTHSFLYTLHKDDHPMLKLKVFCLNSKFTFFVFFPFHILRLVGADRVSTTPKFVTTSPLTSPDPFLPVYPTYGRSSNAKIKGVLLKLEKYFFFLPIYVPHSKIKKS